MISQMTWQKACLAAGVLCAVNVASADSILVSYDRSASGAVSNISSAVTGDTLTAAPGVTSRSTTTFNYGSWDTANTSFAEAFADDEFWSWGFDVTGAVTIDLTTLDLRVDRSGTGPDDFEVQVAVNGGVTSVLTYDFDDSDTGVTFLDVDLSSLATLVQGDSVVFTLAAFNSESSAGTFDLETFATNRALEVSGVVTPVGATIPTPASAMAGLLGMVGLVARRRR